jgi:uncharacterized protein (DUF427 family)
MFNHGSPLMMASYMSTLPARRPVVTWSILAYYIPRDSITSAFKLTKIPNKASLCEWKGKATYWSLTNKTNGEQIDNKIWSYEAPTPAFKDIKGYLSFYASGVPWDCYVDEEKVAPQEG